MVAAADKHRKYELPFDRILGNSSHVLPSILYTDITSPSFANFHNILSKTAREGKTSYRIRHKPSLSAPNTPLVVNGYGIELQLKRTDYIVIDDRQAQEKGGKDATQKTQDKELHEEEDVADLKPLSSSEVNDLAVNAADFVLASDQPMDTLLKLVQDFPKYSSVVAAHNASEDFLAEHEANRMQLVPSGYNVVWINGVQIPNRDINPFTILEHLRRERKLINGVRSQGLSGAEAIDLLSNPAIAETQAQDEPQRYDFRDETEGGRVIIWLNDLEKDKRYEDWPSHLNAVRYVPISRLLSTDSIQLLQRTFPGQLPGVRRDIHNIIIPVDFTSKEDVYTVVETIQGMVKRMIPVRWGIVPKTLTAGSKEQAKVVYHLLDTYGLAKVIRYLEAVSAYQSSDLAVLTAV
jgi:UDP-glucose:glycoprotein glucosyltransferase